VSDIGSVVASLKQSAGLPTQGVNQGGDSPVPSNARQSVAQQNENVATILKAANDKMAAQANEGGQSELEKALEAKDKAISDLRAQNEQLNQANLAKLDGIEALLRQSTEQPKGEDPINIPGLSDEIDNLPADLQIAKLKEAVSNIRDSVVSELRSRDENIKRVFGPLASEVSQLKQIKDRNMVTERFPHFDYPKYEGEIAQLRAELPAMSALEAASVVAAKHDPKMLLSDEPTAPVVMEQRPSMDAASGHRTGNSQPQESEEDISALLKDAIVKSRNSGNTSQANRLLEELLKRKVKPSFL